MSILFTLQTPENSIYRFLNEYSNNIVRIVEANSEQHPTENPTDNSFIEKLKSQEKTFETETDICCSICLDNFKKGDRYIELPCGDQPHFFHYGNENCGGIFPWLSKNNTCPVCRFSLPKETTSSDTNNESEQEPGLSPDSTAPDSIASDSINLNLSEETVENISENINNGSNSNRLVSNVHNYIQQLFNIRSEPVGQLQSQNAEQSQNIRNNISDISNSSINRIYIPRVINTIQNNSVNNILQNLQEQIILEETIQRSIIEQ